MPNWPFSASPKDRKPYERVDSHFTSHELAPMQDLVLAQDTAYKSPGNTSTKTTTQLLQNGDEIDHPLGETQFGLGERRASRGGIVLSGWRVGVSWCAGSATAVLFINIIWTIWASATYGVKGGIGTMQSGSCDEAKKLSLWLHLAINALSTALLAASNYCMQCLASPTRKEIDKAHARHKWLDIGVPSVQNLSHISKTRTLLWSLLAISGIPLHLLYNSAVFTTLSATDYSVWAISSELAEASPAAVRDRFASYHKDFNDSDLEKYLRTFAGFQTWDKLSNRDCLQLYGQSFVSTHGTLYLVSSGPVNQSRVVESIIGHTGLGAEDGDISYDWMCGGNPKCDVDQFKQGAETWMLTRYAMIDREKPLPVLPIDYCYSQPVPERCSVQFSTTVMAIVIVANAVKAVCMFCTLWRQEQAPLVTLGDAIQSFLTSNDPATEDQCLATKKKYIHSRLFRNEITDNWSSQPLRWKRKPSFWFQSASTTRWLVCNVLCVVTLATAGSLLKQSINSSRNSSISYLWSMGFGTTTAESMTNPINTVDMSRSYALFSYITLANLPQPILSFLFLFYNSLYTCMLLTQEWFDYARDRKTLRVTNPRGHQRSTYRLQLPYKYGIPLVIVSGVLHWLVSQSLFLVNVQGFDPYELIEGGEEPTKTWGKNYNIISLGYSCIALIMTILLGGITILTGIAMGFRRYNGEMPLATHCSAAISAACHQPTIDVDAARLPVMWGVVEGSQIGLQGGGTDEGVGHCSFTSFSVVPPQEGRQYAGNMRKRSN